MPRITKRTVDALKPGLKDKDYWDDQIPGFGVRVKPSGMKSYVLRYRTRTGGQRRVTLGQHGKLTPDQARQMAQDLFAKIRNGQDPSQDRHKERAAPTLRELAERYMTDYVEIHNKPSTARESRRILEKNLLPRLGNRKVADLSYEDAARLHGSMRATPYEANRTLSLFSAMLTRAEKWGMRPRSSNPCRDVERYPETPRDRHLSYEELGRLGEVLDATEAQGSEPLAAVKAIRLLILSGARLNEALTLQWSWVDLQGGCLRLGDSKVGPRVIFLGTPAVELLRGIPRQEGNPYVFAGRRAGAHLVGLQKCWERIRERAGLEDVCLHTLRHTFATTGGELGFSPILIAGLLGHRSWAKVAGLAGFATTEGYMHVSANPLRQVAEAISRRLTAALERHEADILSFSMGGRAGR